jgi:DNA polymerase
MAACAPYLQRQLEVLDPALIVTLGRYSLGTFRPGERIGVAHGTTRPAAARDEALAFAMYHPAYAVRDKNNEPILFADMASVPAALIDARRRRSATAVEPEPPAPSPDTRDPEPVMSATDDVMPQLTLF